MCVNCWTAETLNVTILLGQGELQANKQYNTTVHKRELHKGRSWKRMPLPVELTMSQGLKGDTGHIQAHHSKWKVLLIIQ
jgi:hypothetical protein